jgi:DNA-directed RNA polymerase specialized sigma24 family protein
MSWPALDTFVAIYRREPTDLAALRVAFARPVFVELTRAAAVAWQVGAAGSNRDDVLQEARAKLWSALETRAQPLASATELVRLFRTIVARTAIDLYRRGKREQLGANRDDSMVAIGEPEVVPVPARGPAAALWDVYRVALVRYPWLQSLVWNGELVESQQRGETLIAFANARGLLEDRVYQYWARFQWGTAAILMVDDDLRAPLSDADLNDAAQLLASWLEDDLERAVLRGETPSRLARRLAVPLATLKDRLARARDHLLGRAAASAKVEKARYLREIVRRAWRRLGIVE